MMTTSKDRQARALHILGEGRCLATKPEFSCFISNFVHSIVDEMSNKPSVMLTQGGLWNTAKAQYSPETTKLLKS